MTTPIEALRELVEANDFYSRAMIAPGFDIWGAKRRVDEAWANARAALEPAVSAPEPIPERVLAKPDRFEVEMSDGRRVTLWREIAERAAVPAAPLVEPAERWRHKKTGGVYELLGRDGRLESDPDGPALVAYRSVETGKVWIRIQAEWDDGRFERIDPSVGS